MGANHTSQDSSQARGQSSVHLTGPQMDEGSSIFFIVIFFLQILVWPV